MLSWPREWGWVGGRWWNTREGGPQSRGNRVTTVLAKGQLSPHCSVHLCPCALWGGTDGEHSHPCAVLRANARDPPQLLVGTDSLPVNVWIPQSPGLLSSPFHLRDVYFMYEKFTKTGRKLIKMLPTLFTNCTLVNQTPTFSNCFIQWLSFCFNFVNSVF